MTLSEITGALTSGALKGAIDIGIGAIPNPIAQGAVRAAVALLPTAAALIERLGAGELTAEQVQAEWLRNQALYQQGRRDWAAAKPGETDGA